MPPRVKSILNIIYQILNNVNTKSGRLTIFSQGEKLNAAINLSFF